MARITLRQGMRGKDVRALQNDLRSLGWPLKNDGHYGEKTREAVHDFKRGFAFWKIGNSDGRAFGVAARAALKYSKLRGGKASKTYYFRQWKSKGNGWIKVHRDLVLGLEKSHRAGQDKMVISGYRDPAYNASVGGASDSQHKFGNATDLNEMLSLARVKALRAFSGIGVQRSNGKVRHVDVRHVGPNPTNGSVTHPTIWYY